VNAKLLASEFAPLRRGAGAFTFHGSPFSMIAPETFNHIENIKKRAGHLWRFL
jgi:hypothetical protein